MVHERHEQEADKRMAALSRRAEARPQVPAVEKAAMHATASFMEHDEEALLRRVKEGETALFYELIRPYQKSVFMTAVSILGNSADAEDAAQEAFLKALARINQFRGEARFSTWLIQITINEARMRLRKDRRNLYESIDEGVDNEEGEYMPRDFADWREIPTEALQRKELKQALLNAIAALPTKYREVFVLRDVQHLSITETAQMLGISEASVKTRLLRARFQMRDALAPGIDGSWVTGREEYKKVRPW
ncbi:MAG TPA: sigma-70 family RNA polymerase sigma factor [Terriglobales bacterium]|jgi:RNA polymerase sigma-70 factor (ECF subfamily)|nr:sigma-70 family RNA polymerase sigma factor [Terriglobales bacterium]